VCRIWRSNYSNFKRIECCWSYATSLSLSARYERLDKTLDRPCWEPRRYVIIKLKCDNDRFQRAWYRFNTRADIIRRKPSPNSQKLMQFPTWINTNGHKSFWTLVHQSCFFYNKHILSQLQKMCHYEHSVKIHVKMCERGVRNLVRIWNALSLSISCNWQVSLAYSMLNYFLWIQIIEYEKKIIVFVWMYTIYSIFCIINNILYMITAQYIQHIIYSILNSNTMDWHCIQIQLQRIIQIQWVNFLSQHSTCIFSIRFFLDNAYGTIILQAFISKYLIEYENVKKYISLNMNILKITNDVSWWILC
jgi:hypothetical protein